MAANCPISKAGTRSRKPIGSLGLTAGAGKLSNPNASLPARTAGPSWRSISPEFGSPCMRMARPSFGRVMAPAKGAAPHRARCTTSPSRSRKPMPPNGHWRPSANPSVLSSIGAAGQHHPRSPYSHRLLSLGLPSPCRPTPISASIRTIRPLFHGHPATMAVVRIWSRGIGRRVAVNLEVRPSAGTSIIVPCLTRPRSSTNRQEPSHHRRAQTAARQSPSEIRRLATLPGLRPATVRSASPALCPTQSARSQSQRRVHRTALPRSSSAAASGRQ